MNEGKPTKAKWWSRPRASEDAPDGDFELERPRPSHTTGTADAGGGGDFELERPAAPGATDGDYDLPLPERDAPTGAPPHPRTARDADPTAAPDPDRQPGADATEPADAGGHRQEASPPGPSTAAAPHRQGGAAPQPSDAGLSRQGGGEIPEPPGAGPSLQAGPEVAGPPDAGLPRQGDRHGAPVADAESPSPAGTAAAAPAADGPSGAERPKPLHEPDPYSTPPYGEPGPWAPAPPVQHPAATPAHGTATPPAPAPVPPPPGAVPDPAFADAPPPVPQGQHPGPTPAHGTAPVPHAPVPSATAGPHAPAPPPSASSVSPPRGPVPDPAFADAPPPVPRAGQEQHPAAAAPAYDTAAHAAAPAYDTTPHAAAPATTAVPATPPSDPSPVTAPDPWAGPTAPAPGVEPAADPWGRYDPWAAAAQHHDPADRVPGRRRRPAAKVLVGGALLIALVSGGIGGAVGAHLERNGGMGTVELPQAGPEAAERDPDSVAGIAARALPSVVTLHVSGSEAAGTGTGFVLDDRGHILTNNHVVEPAGSGGEITVTFNSGDTAEAEVVGRDSGYDLAVVKVKGVTGLTPMPLGNSENVHVGDPVVAIGAPFDLAGTVTSGIISAKERPITAGGEEGDASDVSYVDALQTDAPINPGNSGGPLLDARGRAIGINSAIRSADSGSAESDGGQAGSIGLGFAIPINQGKRVAEELINTGRATHPVIGITLDMNYTGDGARVSAKDSDGGPAVTTGGPGAKAGIKPGDVITAVDGQRVHSGEELIVKTRAHRPGDRLELTLERDGKETKVSLVLGSSGGD
ncbi:S1C family serine protease [Streptomyces tendae]|uniref:S1C family serine protease n=1 Tax=Streptomyces tendae TaxID=1932 RepID=UPI00132F8409|nr:trypsin-like peptidase domain-containing protein [Streptomyces tendae]